MRDHWGVLGGTVDAKCNSEQDRNGLPGLDSVRHLVQAPHRVGLAAALSPENIDSLSVRLVAGAGSVMGCCVSSRHQQTNRWLDQWMDHHKTVSG